MSCYLKCLLQRYDFFVIVSILFIDMILRSLLQVQNMLKVITRSKLGFD